MLLGQGHSFARIAQPNGLGALDLARREGVEEQIGSTRPRRGSQWPNQSGVERTRSSGHEPFFSCILRIGAADPVLGSFPTDAQALERAADTGSSGRGSHESLRQADLRHQWERPEIALDTKIARAAMQQIAQGWQILVGNAGA